MNHFELVEKLRQKADVTYEEAKDALEATDWDILDALVLLEGQGKVRPEESSEYTTQPEPAPAQESEQPNEFRDGWHKFWHFLRTIFQKANANSFIISRGREEIVNMPVSVMVLLLILCWPFSMVVLVIGLFVGFRYAFRGPDMGGRLNRMMDKAADAVQDKENRVE